MSVNGEEDSSRDQQKALQAKGPGTEHRRAAKARLPGDVACACARFLASVAIATVLEGMGGPRTETSRRVR